METTIQNVSIKEQTLCHYDDLLRYAYKLTKNKDDAKDIVQETFYKAYANFDKFTIGTNLRAWLFKILYNQFCTQYRKKSNTMEVSENNIVENSSMPDNKISESEIIYSICNLDKKYKMISLLFFLNEYTYSEIENLTNLKLGTVKSRIFRSRDILRDKIDRKIKARTYLKAV